MTSTFRVYRDDRLIEQDWPHEAYVDTTAVTGRTYRYRIEINEVDSPPAEIDVFVAEPDTHVFIANREIDPSDLPATKVDAFRKLGQNLGSHVYGAKFDWRATEYDDLSWMEDCVQVIWDRVVRFDYMFIHFAGDKITALQDLGITGHHYLTGSCRRMFYGAWNFNDPIVNEFDTGRVTDFAGMFEECSVFNQPLTGWDTSNGAQCWKMFADCSELDQDLSHLQFPLAEDFWAMFQNCTVFNNGGSDGINDWMQPGWAGPTDLSYMFNNCRAFNQPLDQWDLSKIDKKCEGPYEFPFDVENAIQNPRGDCQSCRNHPLNSFLVGASSFDQDLSSWDFDWLYNVRNVVDDINKCFFWKDGTPAFHKEWYWPQWRELPTDVTIIVANGPVTWDMLPTRLYNNYSLREHPGASNKFTYEACFKWDNARKRSMHWVLNVLAFRENQLHDGDYAFQGFDGYRIDAWAGVDFSNIDSLEYTFKSSPFDLLLDGPDYSPIKSFRGMFEGASNFNQTINWSTPQAESMEIMFKGARAFNKRIYVDTNRVTNMDGMFWDATNMCANLSHLCVPNITSKPPFFDLNACFDYLAGFHPKWGLSC